MSQTSIVKNNDPVCNTLHFSQENLSALEEIMYEHTYEKGAHLFWEGEQADKLFYIKEGRVQAAKTTEDGKSFILSMYQSGDLLGEVSYSTKLLTNYFAVAVTDCVIGVIQQSDLEVLLWQRGDLAIQFSKWLGLMNRVNQSKFRDLTFFGKPGALTSTLIRLANSYGKPHKKGILIDCKLTNTQLGEFIGATRESVNRLLNDLKDKDVISYERSRIIIRNINYLKAICHCESCPLEICRM